MYFFGRNTADGSSEMRGLLGGKGANLAEMCKFGIPVPPGFTIPSDECGAFYDNEMSLSPSLVRAVGVFVEKIESFLSDGRKFGNVKAPLLLSVRSGASVSMPGMMDTVLNLGLNDATVDGLGDMTGDFRFAYDSYRRFIQMYSSVVLGVDRSVFEKLLTDKKKKANIQHDADLDQKLLSDLVDEYKVAVLKETGAPFPQDVHGQLFNAISAVFLSWMGDRAIYYRKINDISDKIGTAVTVQSMVFGNAGQNSCTGVVFTRNPSNGEKKIYGEYLLNAQGEDVVAGIRTPSRIDGLASDMPDVYEECLKVFASLERHYKDMQDIEFTVECGKLWILQTRAASRSAMAEVKVAVDLVKEGLISKPEAITRVNPKTLERLLHRGVDVSVGGQMVVSSASGVAASPGAASGVVALSCGVAIDFVETGLDVILVRRETSPEDVEGMHVCRGIVTVTGGATSHAAVVARGMGRPCITGAFGIEIDEVEKTVTFADKSFVREGQTITIDGSSGFVFNREMPMKDVGFFDEFGVFMSWVDDVRKTGVRTNAETESDVGVAIGFGADGIGLCRTEHMFFTKTRIIAVRKMILAGDKQTRLDALRELEAYQVKDFVSIFQILGERPINIRLLDPPLHEFLPHKDQEIEELSVCMAIPVEALSARIDKLRESNPMLGNRGCRLGFTFPEIYQMQVRAIFKSIKDTGKKNVEIMVPFVATVPEIKGMRKMIDDVAKEYSVSEYKMGTMIEVPRAAILADKIAPFVDYFSFGTNDLTQMTLGISRDDSGSFLTHYVDCGMFVKDPFVVLDVEGVGSLISGAVDAGKKANEALYVSVCGEHGGDPESIAFFVSKGFRYVSCSPYRVPVAKLAAVRAEMDGIL